MDLKKNLKNCSEEELITRTKSKESKSEEQFWRRTHPKWNESVELERELILGGINQENEIKEESEERT